MSKTIKLEALIASPPTSKCEETIEILEELIRCHPDELRLVVFYRGGDIFPEDASMGMRTMMQKGSPVPVVIVGGTFFSSCRVPNREDLKETVEKMLLRTDVE